ncbi:hypothetical protein AVEN_265497-1 [Araneus ventricosus]|uniref:Uncharacterized protein n=1 Tax=Araneus ventricosus TaxID=182803 RepID=A0A4Y2H6V9_ARAVE|nr:hypothetical protein AVEN_265497-1 [Araneus ventricosus]
MGDPLLYTSCHLTSSFHFTKPSSENSLLWRKNLILNKQSRIKIAKLINFFTQIANQRSLEIKQTATLAQRMHPIRHWPWTLPQLPQEIRSPFYRLLRMWGNRKSPTLRNEMPSITIYFIISPQGTKSTVHSPLVEVRPSPATSRNSVSILQTTADVGK